MHEFNAYKFHHSMMASNNGSHHSSSKTLSSNSSSSSSSLTSTPLSCRAEVRGSQQQQQQQPLVGGNNNRKQHFLHIVQEVRPSWTDIGCSGDDLQSSTITTSKIYDSSGYENSNYHIHPSIISSLYQQHCYHNNIQHHQHPNNLEHLTRSDSGNSSLNTNIDSLSNSSTRSVTTSSNCSGSFDDDDFLLINVFVPETQSEFDITCPYGQSIWYVKNVLIERCGHHGGTGLRDQKLNYGFFSNQLGHFLDEQLTFYDYFGNDNLLPLNNLHSNTTTNNQQNLKKIHNIENNHKTTPTIKLVKLEFLYKQRVKFGEIMSTLPLASATRKKRKRSRLLNAIQNGNLDKLAKALVNCDPNFVDESTGETPLSLAAALQTSNPQLQQQIIVAIVNGGALLDFRTKDGRTALHVAVQKSNFVSLKTLLDLGASPNYLDANGLTPLYYSVIYKSNPKLTQLLLYEHASHGITDQHGWQEVHHASKLGLVQHLEHLLYYGCDMNCKIVGSGNTSLHVAAINDQTECARMLLLRGCDTNTVNNSHQNAYQVAVIAANMSLADMIKNHKVENIVPYRDKPRYNPARRPAASSNSETPNKSSKLLSADVNGGDGNMRAISPSLSQLTNNTTTTSSGVCCEDEDYQNRTNKQRSVINNPNAQNLSADNEDDEDDDDDGEDEQNGVISTESEDSRTFAPGMMVRAVSDYNSGDPSHMQLRRNDHVLLLHSDHSPPTIASQKLLLGRRCLDGKEGFFPACCVEKIKPIKDTDWTDRVEGRRDMKLKNMQAATLPTRGRRGARKSYLDKNTTRQYQDRTVTLHRGTKGFGFVLRGAKDSSPILTKQLMQQGTSVPLIGLQYFDEIEVGGVADAAGLKRGDFLLAVNDVDVRHMSHENVVQLIRQSGDKVTMTIATPVPKQLVSILKKKGTKQSPVADKPSVLKTENGNIETMEHSATMPSSQSQMQMSQSVYASFTNRVPKAPPPAPPKRDPSTTLSTSRARARSLVVASEVRTARDQSLMLMNEVKTAVDDNPTKTIGDSKNEGVDSLKTIRNSRRISSYEPNEMNLTNSIQVEKAKPKTTVESLKDSTDTLKTNEQAKRNSCTMSPPTSPLHSIVNVTLTKAKTNNELANNVHSLSSFQPTSNKQSNSQFEPPIPEPDYSSDEDENNKKIDGEEASKNKGAEKVKFTTKATVVLRSASPCPPESTANGEAKSADTITGARNGMIGSRNIFEELKEQSAKITSAARLRFAAAENGSETNQTSGTDNVSGKVPNNVKKNVAEFEKRLNGSVKEQILNDTQLRMSKSCMDDFVPQTISTLKKEGAPKPSLKQQKQNDQTDLRRNSAIISAMAEKVAAVNQLVAEQQLQHSGSKSLNSSPIPISLTKIPGQGIAGSTVVVQKPIAILPGGSGSSGTLTRRCVTVCEDPVKTIHFQQQHQQIRSQLAAAAMLNTAVGGTGTLTKSKPHSTSLAESTGSILKQPKTQIRAINQGAAYSTTTGTSTIDVVPPPPEFAASIPQSGTTRQTTATAHVVQQPTALQQQKIYIQRQLQQSAPVTIQNASASGNQSSVLQQQQQQHHHHTHQQPHSQLITGEMQHYGHQTAHYHHHHHNHPHQSASSAGITLSSSAPTSNTDGHTLMRQSILAQHQPSSNYDYLIQRGSSTNPSIVGHHHQLSSASSLPQQIYIQQSSVNQQQQQQQNQLILQQRALAVANAKLYQQQQLSRSGGQYNTLASSKPQQQIQYYIAQQHSHPSNSPPPQQQQQPQYLATLSRHQHAQVQQQYLNSLSSQQQQMQQQQFATLTRHHQQQLIPSAHQQNLVNYSQLVQRQQPSQQQQQQQQIGTSNVTSATSGMTSTGRVVQATSTGNVRQTPAKLVHQYALQQYQQQHQHQQLSIQQTTQQQPQQQVAYARKSVVEWTGEDVQEWLQRIGMAEHRMKFESFNGAKMLRLDNNSLANIGVRQQQHRIYILEKLKQQIWQNHQ